MFQRVSENQEFSLHCSSSPPGPLRLTFRDEGGDEAGGSGYEVGGSEGKATADTFDGEEDEEGSGELHQARDEEVDVDVPSQDSQPHDQTLVHDRTGEPGRDEERQRWIRKLKVHPFIFSSTLKKTLTSCS